ncbi:MAG: hypothetical protein KDD56_01880 [Bdellovibrionales bacterium]|nr:hypothetical protein [Bdellovibrionales bacterium]
MKQLSFLLFFFAIPFNAIAEDSNVNKKPLTRTELRKWELEIADHTYSFEKNPDNVSEVLNSLENYAQLICMPKLYLKLSYTQEDLQPQCNDLIDRLFSINPNNPTAICIRDGLEASSCQEAFSNQSIISGSIKSHPKYLQNTYGTGPIDVISSDHESQNLAEHVKQACSQSQIILQAKKSQKQEVDNILKGAKIFNQLLNKDNDLKEPSEIDDIKKEGAEFSIESLERVRKITKDCQNAVSVLEKKYPFHPFVPCFREGFFTPNCAKQKLQNRNTRAKVPNKQLKNSKPEKNFSTF